MLTISISGIGENRVMVTGNNAVPKSFPSSEYCGARVTNYNYPMIFHITFNKNYKCQNIMYYLIIFFF